MGDMVVMRSVLNVPDEVLISGLRLAVEDLKPYAAVQVVRDGDGLPTQLAIEFQLDGATPEELVQAGLQLAGISNSFNAQLASVGLQPIDTAKIWLSPRLARSHDANGHEVTSVECPSCGAASDEACHFIDGSVEDVNVPLPFVHVARQNAESAE